MTGNRNQQQKKHDQAILVYSGDQASFNLPQLHIFVCFWIGLVGSLQRQDCHYGNSYHCDHHTLSFTIFLQKPMSDVTYTSVLYSLWSKHGVYKTGCPSDLLVFPLFLSQWLYLYIVSVLLCRTLWTFSNKPFIRKFTILLSFSGMLHTSQYRRW